MITLASPLFLLLAIPVGLAAWRMVRRRRAGALAFTGLARLGAPPRTWRTAAAAVSPVLTTAGLLLGVIALARPQTVLSRTWRSADVIAVCMVVDTSGSMQALDFSTAERQRSRLDVVKESFAGFIAARPDDLIGLVTFAGYPASRAPLTSDHDALLHVLKGVEIPVTVLGADGSVVNQEEFLTAIGDALAAACARLKGADVKSRVIVLLSDGEANFGVVKPLDAARAAAALGIRVYTIGVGSTGEALFPLKDPFGRTVVRPVRVSLDEALLQKIAETAGGRYFNVRDARGLKRAMEDIDRLEKTRVETEQYEERRELFAWVLVPGLLLGLAGASLSFAATRSVA